MKKRIASAFLAACLIFPLISCRGERPEPERESYGRFRGTEVTLPDSFKIGAWLDLAVRRNPAGRRMVCRGLRLY